MFTNESILLKKGWRSDRFWTHPIAFKSFLKFIPLYFDTRALMKSQFWPREKLDRYQDARLLELFRDAKRVPYWRDLLEKVGVDHLTPREVLARMPIISKQQLVQQPPADITDESLIERSDEDHTSGSTGIPFHFYHDWHASLRSFAITERIFRTLIAKRFPIVYMRARPRNGFTFYRHFWFFLRSYNSMHHRLEELKELAQQFPAGFILYGYTSWIVEAARQMEKNDIKLPIRSVVVAGEHLIAHDRSYIERIMKTELFTLYASREAGFLGYECEHHTMHFSEEWAYVEIVDIDNRPLPSGKEGRIVVTTFDNRVMPFIRYDIGDIGVLSDIPCACGRTLRTLTFKGRTSELINLDGRVVSLLDIAYALGAFKDAIHQYQIVQNGPMSFLVRVIPGPAFEDKKQHLESLLLRMLHPRVQIRWECTDTIPASPNGKAIYFLREFDNV